MNTTHNPPPGIAYKSFSTKWTKIWCAHPSAYGHLSAGRWGVIRGVAGCLGMETSLKDTNLLVEDAENCVTLFVELCKPLASITYFLASV
jgi:hypothetical protein